MLQGRAFADMFDQSPIASGQVCASSIEPSIRLDLALASSCVALLCCDFMVILTRYGHVALLCGVFVIVCQFSFIVPDLALLELFL